MICYTFLYFDESPYGLYINFVITKFIINSSNYIYDDNIIVILLYYYYSYFNEVNLIGVLFCCSFDTFYMIKYKKIIYRIISIKLRHFFFFMFL